MIAVAAKERNLDIWCYTGFLYTWLTDERNPHYSENMELLEYINVLIDGRFLVEKKDFRLKFRGSSNQQIIDVQRSLKEKEIHLSPYHYA